MPPPPYRVLSLDGGGMRGLYTVTVLDTLARRFGGTPGKNPFDIATGYDLIVGTSTGAILASAIAAGIPTDTIIAFYRERGPLIFTDPMPKGMFAFLRWAWRHRSTAGNSQAALASALSEIFGDLTVQQLWERRQTALCITTVNLITQHPRVFKTPHNPKKCRDNNWTIRDICLASTAAPIYLPLARIKDPDQPTLLHAFVDGGLWANNPSLVGLVEAIGMAGPDQAIEIVSLGTCAPAIGRSLGQDPGNWGLHQWRFGGNIAEASMEASANGVSYMMQFLAPQLRTPCRFVRLEQTQPSLEHLTDISLDSTTVAFFESMTSLARHDADEIYGKHLRDGASPYSLLAGIFADTTRT